MDGRSVAANVVSAVWIRVRAALYCSSPSRIRTLTEPRCLLASGVDAIARGQPVRRSAFSGAAAEWRPSGSRDCIPTGRLGCEAAFRKRAVCWAERTSQQVDQIGRFARNLWRRLRFQITTRQDCDWIGSYRNVRKTEGTAPAGSAMSSILKRCGGSVHRGLVVKAISAA